MKTEILHALVDKLANQLAYQEKNEKEKREKSSLCRTWECYNPMYSSRVNESSIFLRFFENDRNLQEGICQG